MYHCVGVDFTASNAWQGQQSFSGKSLHNLERNVVNPYQHVNIINYRVQYKTIDNNYIFFIIG